MTRPRQWPGAARAVLFPMRMLPVALLLGAFFVLPAPLPQAPQPEFSAPPGSAEPFLTATPNGGLLATWFEPRVGELKALRIAERRDGRWSEPVTVAERPEFFVNWADFPSVAATADGRWVVHWLEKTATKAYAYHIRMSTSADRGRSWTAPVTPHADRSPTEHGFVAMLPRPAGGVDMVWLDGRQTTDTAAHGGHGPMALAGGALDASGKVLPDALLDTRVCDCCQTALARTSEGLVAVYRDRSEAEVRDISVVRQVNGRWTAPAKVASDGWTYRACPVNGPSIAAREKEVAVAWFTSADGTPRVKLARSADAAASFGAPLTVDDGNPLGRTDVEMLPDGSVLVTWLEIVGDQAEWRIKRFDTGGKVTARWTVGSAPRTRQAGFARTALAGGDLFVAWTAPGPTGGVRVQRLTLLKR
jgi:hypothetical protein